MLSLMNIKFNYNGKFSFLIFPHKNDNRWWKREKKTAKSCSLQTFFSFPVRGIFASREENLKNSLFFSLNKSDVVCSIVFKSKL